MKYFISKPDSHKINMDLIKQIKYVDKNAEIVDTLDEANICVFQKGWTRSKKCIFIYNRCRAEHIEYHEEYLYYPIKGLHLN